MKAPVSRLDDDDMKNAYRALLRASVDAWELAARTGTAFVIVRDNKIVLEYPKPGQPHPAISEEDINEIS